MDASPTLSYFAICQNNFKGNVRSQNTQPHQASNFTSLAGGGGKNHWGREKSLGQQAVRRALLLGTVSAGDCMARKGWGRGGEVITAQRNWLTSGNPQSKANG